MKKELSNQVRELYTESALSIRESEKEPVIDGVAIVTNKRTVLWEGDTYREVEIVESSCIDKAFIDAQDIKLNLYHDRQKSIARTPKSLRVEPREDGLHFDSDIPDCDLGKQAQALIDNGTIRGCSFEFYPKTYTTTEEVGADGKKEYVIRHTEFKKITALTLALDPAYKQTSVSVRELFEEQHPVEESSQEEREDEAKAEADKQAAEQAAQAEKEAQEAKAREIVTSQQKIARIRRETEMLNQQ